MESIDPNVFHYASQWVRDLSPAQAAEVWERSGNNLDATEESVIKLWEDNRKLIRPEGPSNSPQFHRHTVAHTNHYKDYPYQILSNNVYSSPDRLIPFWLSNWGFKTAEGAMALLAIWVGYKHVNKDSEPIRQWDFQVLGKIEAYENEAIFIPPHHKADW